MTRNSFNSLEKGNFLLFKSGRCRAIIAKSRDNRCVTFKKVNGYGETVYMYCDIKDKVIGVLKFKKRWQNLTETNPQ